MEALALIVFIVVGLTGKHCTNGHPVGNPVVIMKHGVSNRMLNNDLSEVGLLRTMVYHLEERMKKLETFVENAVKGEETIYSLP